MRSPRLFPERPVATVLILLFLGLVAWHAEAADPADAVEIAREITSSPQYQTEMPDARASSFEGGMVGGALAAFLGLLLKVLVLAGAVLLIGWLARDLLARFLPGNDEHAASGRPAPSVGAPATLPDPAREARLGRYDRAIHDLLQLAIGKIVKRHPQTDQPSRTSRELLRLLPLEATARSAFAELVRAVELSYFGGSAVDERDFRTCLAHYRACTGEDLA
jgi:hypothetical protein